METKFIKISTVHLYASALRPVSLICEIILETVQRPGRIRSTCESIYTEWFTESTFHLRVSYTFSLLPLPRSLEADNSLCGGHGFENNYRLASYI